LNLSQISRKEIPLPSLSEQQSIANFLDHHVNLIDRDAVLIDKKIELLSEKRKALIFECVTGKRTVVQRSSLPNTQNA
ncbi:restriction endonuclease subunit S, partial [Rhizobium johnstonii]